MKLNKVTCFYRYNEKTERFDYNHYEDGHIDYPLKDVKFESGKWDYMHEFKDGHKISTNGVFK